MKMPNVKRGHVPGFLGRDFSNKNKNPVGRPDATHNFENARDISISANQ
jgi:hypothetical protein